jgi:hypothetical protein
MPNRLLLVVSYFLVKLTSTAESSTRLSYRGTIFVATLMLYICHSERYFGGERPKLDFYYHVDFGAAVLWEAAYSHGDSRMFSYLTKDLHKKIGGAVYDCRMVRK